jgi:ATP-dependent RNA helicase HelY
MSSPSEAYARFRAEQRRERTQLAVFRERFDFALDPFQVDGCEALEHGDSVLVAAPTGAGKTIVGEFAVHLALSQGRKVFYTTPIKALSNQKHDELRAWLGHERVGLLTGDVSLHPEADVVVMTTEVLRNMLYAGSPLLDGLGFVVMDEVHYLADRLRGPVWEEVIIHLDRSVQLVALSATVSNAEEFGTWLAGPCAASTDDHRLRAPVPCRCGSTCSWETELMDLFVDEDGERVVSTRRRERAAAARSIRTSSGSPRSRSPWTADAAVAGAAPAGAAAADRAVAVAAGAATAAEPADATARGSHGGDGGHGRSGTRRPPPGRQPRGDRARTAPAPTAPAVGDRRDPGRRGPAARDLLRLLARRLRRRRAQCVSISRACA